MPTSKFPERSIVFIVAAVQFINILDFMMVMPLGPDFAESLNIPTSNLGYIGGAYTASAAISGILGSFVLDRFDRRVAMALAMLGLVLGTAAGGFATGLPSLLAARILAGFFGGPATSIAISIVSDVVPPERRGRAMGVVMGAFSIASIFGVPAGLELARIGGWRMPFFGVAALGVVVTACAIKLLPPLKGHLAGPRQGKGSIKDLFANPLILLSYAMMGIAMMAAFLVIPNIASYVQTNLSYPREKLGILYLAGGATSFVSTIAVGRLVDRYGSFKVGTVGTIVLSLVVYTSFVVYPPHLPVWGSFMGFMLAMSTRNLSGGTLSTKVPRPSERAQYMSFQSAVQHISCAAGAFLSSQMLTEDEGKRLVGMSGVATLCIVLACVYPVLLFLVESGLRKRNAAAEAAAAQLASPST